MAWHETVRGTAVSLPLGRKPHKKALPSRWGTGLYQFFKVAGNALRKSRLERAAKAGSHWAAVLLFPVFMAGCSFLPGNGPAGMSIQEDDLPDGYVVVDVDQRAIAALKWRGNSSLKNMSQYRPASAPVMGIGDVIQVTIWEAAPGNLFATVGNTPGSIGSVGSASIPPQTVSRTGTINVPFAGDIKVVGKSTRDVEKSIVGQLKAKAVDPQALVTVVKSADSSVTVAGDAVGGGQVQLSPNNERILEVVAVTGGIKAPVHDTFVSLARGDRIATVSYITLMSDPAENIRLSARDVLTVFSHKRTYTVFGATLRNTEVPFDAPTLTLAQALARANMDDEKADASAIYVLRFEPSEFVPVLLGNKSVGAANGRVPVVYRFNLRDPKGFFLAQSFYMIERDMIYIPDFAGAELGKVLRIFGGAAGPASAGASIAVAATRY